MTQVFGTHRYWYRTCEAYTGTEGASEPSKLL
jgi:hypothetical protein